MKYLSNAYRVGVLALLSMPVWAYAAIVQCSGSKCRACDLVALANNIITFLIAISVSIAVILFCWAGFKMVTASGNISVIREAKSTFVNVFIGIVLVLAAFLIIDLVMKSLVDPNWLGGPWNQIKCVDNPIFAQGVKNGTGGVVSNPGADAGGTEGRPVDPNSQYTEAEARAALAAAGIAVNNPPCAAGQTSGCTDLNGINKDTIAQVINIQKSCGCAVTITGGTEGGHSAGEQSHGTGYKVDLAPNAKLDSTIQGYTFIGNRSGDGAPQYRDAAGNVYAREGNHWDITVKAVG